MRTLRRVVLSVSVVSLFASVGAGAEQQDGDDPTFERLVRMHIPRLTSEERTRRATAAGELRIRGRVRLSGTVFATGVHIERGADVETDGDLVIYSTGGIVVDAPIRAGGAAGGPKKATSPKPGTGAKGADGPSIAMIEAKENIEINEEVLGKSGEDGKSVNVSGGYGRGGDGGHGGAVTIMATKKGATITINERIRPGVGGDGGGATVVGAAGAPGQDGQSAVAIGGAGGACGAVKIKAANVVFAANAKVEFVGGGDGGDATATGGLGGRALSCYGGAAGNGGNATATGGKAGDGADVTVQAKTLLPAGVGAGDFAKEAKFISTGGRAEARSGQGGAGPADECLSGECPDNGRKGYDGGSSGDAYAQGGAGAPGDKISGPAFAGRSSTAAEDAPGVGGDAVAVPASGTNGGDGETARRPGAGGNGGDVGGGTALGGKGGTCRVGTTLAGGPGTGGKGGDATVGEPSNLARVGSGGDGGDCCFNPGGGGGRGGESGYVTIPKATPGSGGRCKRGSPGADGAKQIIDASGNEDGDDGSACPFLPGLSVHLTVSPETPTHGQPADFFLEIENSNPAAYDDLEIEFFHVNGPGKPFKLLTKTMDMPGGSESQPIRAYLSVGGNPPKAGDGQVFEVRINGKVAGRVTFDVK